jgi:cell division cycle 14
MWLRVAHQNIEIIPGKLFFSILRATPTSSRNVFYFSVESDPQFQYLPLVEDFGPPNLPQLYTFFIYVKAILDSHSRLVHFYTSPSATWKSNACVYITFFRMLYLNLTADQAYRPISPLTCSLREFRDASHVPAIFLLSVLDCLRGIEKAIRHGWFTLSDFDLENWSKMELLENGAMDWIIPGKLLAFASPYSMNILPNGVRVAAPDDLLPLFQVFGITHVIRLNTQFYDAAIFKDAGYRHTELFFPDGEVPPGHIVSEFLKTMDSGDVVAIHCKAGIGRTFVCFLTHSGTLAGCYLISRCGFSAREAIAWLRVCRPGCVIGQQQTFLVRYEEELRAAERKEEQYRQAQLLTSQSFFVTPQKGFHIFTEPVVDAYCNNPKLQRVQSPRTGVIKWAPKKKLVPILTIPLDPRTPRRTRKATETTRPGSVKETA